MACGTPVIAFRRGIRARNHRGRPPGFLARGRRRAGRGPPARPRPRPRRVRGSFEARFTGRAAWRKRDYTGYPYHIGPGRPDERSAAVMSGLRGVLGRIFDSRPALGTPGLSFQAPSLLITIRLPDRGGREPRRATCAPERLSAMSAPAAGDRQAPQDDHVEEARQDRLGKDDRGADGD